MSCTFQSKLYVVPFTLLQGDPWSDRFAGSTAQCGQALHKGHWSGILHQLSNHLTNECRRILVLFSGVQIFEILKDLHPKAAVSRCSFLTCCQSVSTCELQRYGWVEPFECVPHWQWITMLTKCGTKYQSFCLPALWEQPKGSYWTPGCSNSSDYSTRLMLLIKQHSWVLVYNGALPQLHPSHCVELHTVVSSFPGLRIHTFQANNMDFSGTWQVYAQENYEEFLKAMGKRCGGRLGHGPSSWPVAGL